MVSFDDLKPVKILHDSYDGPVAQSLDGMGDVNVPITVQRVLGAAGINVSSLNEVYVNNVRASLDSILKGGEQIFISGKLAGA